MDDFNKVDRLNIKLLSGKEYIGMHCIRNFTNPESKRLTFFNPKEGSIMSINWKLIEHVYFYENED
jgi:hypothetical protein